MKEHGVCRQTHMEIRVFSVIQSQRNKYLGKKKLAENNRGKGAWVSMIQ
jgi:hypothetical protein